MTIYIVRLYLGSTGKSKREISVWRTLREQGDDERLLRRKTLPVGGKHLTKWNCAVCHNGHKDDSYSFILYSACLKLLNFLRIYDHIQE